MFFELLVFRSIDENDNVFIGLWLEMKNKERNFGYVWGNSYCK